MVFTEKRLVDSFRLILDLAIQEDIGEGDLTTMAIVENVGRERLKQKACLLAKAKGIICGLPLVKYIFSLNEVSVQLLKKDGEEVKPGDEIALLKGDYGIILSWERIALNLLQRLSGIATLAHHFVKRLKDTKIKVLDTRKTIPGFRYLEKYAVFMGGGENHRLGLYDQYLVKDNHLDFSGGVSEAMEKIIAYERQRRLADLEQGGKGRGKLGEGKLGEGKFGRDKFKITVECRNLLEVKEALRYEVIDQILLDNFPLRRLKKAIGLIRGAKKGEGDKKIEVSGKITLKRLSSYRKLNIDFISSGAITHSAPALDLSLMFIR